MIFLSFVYATHVVILTSCISSSVIVHLDQNFSQNVLSRYGSLPGDRVNFSSLCKFKSSLKSVDLQSLVP